MQSSLDINSLMTDEKVLLACGKCSNLLKEPVQLSCLHNWCRSCTDDEGTTGSTTCALCQEVDVKVKSQNLFLLSHINFLSILKGHARCDLCFGDDCDERAGAEDLCRTCQKLFCSECRRVHDKHSDSHVVTALEDIRSSSSIANKLFLQCLSHGRDYDHACVSCETPMCNECIIPCLKMGHDVEPLRSATIQDYVSQVKRDISDLLQPLGGVPDALRRQEELAFELKNQRQIRLNRIRENKKAILEALDNAYVTAECALHETYDELDRKALELLKCTRVLQTRAGYARLYSHYLLGSEDVVSLMQQQKAILSRLQQLSEELHRLDPPVGEVRMVNYMKFEDGVLPRDLDQQLVTWVGMAKLAQGTNVVALHQEAAAASANEEQTGGEAEGGARRECCSGADLDAVNRPPRLPAAPSYTSPSKPLSRPYPEVREEKDFELRCGDGECRALVATSEQLRILPLRNLDSDRQSSNVLVIDPLFPVRIKVHNHGPPSHIGKTTVRRFSVEKWRKITCKKCDMNWGIAVRISDRYFFLIRCQTLVVRADKVDEPLPNWKYLPYKLKFMKDNELLRNGVEEIPSDDEFDSRWHAEVPEAPPANSMNLQRRSSDDGDL